MTSNPVPWPNGAKCAAAITFDMDADSILHLQYPDDAVRRVATQSFLGFGPKVGIPRILETYRRFGIKQTFFVPGWCAERYSETVEAIVADGHEVAHHGYLHESPNKRSRDEELDWLVRGIEAIEKVTGRRPRGWRAPLYDFSEHSLDLLLGEGFEYDSSLMGDELPYVIRSKQGGEVVELPTEWAMDDAVQYLFSLDLGLTMTIQPPARAIEVFVAELEAACAQGGLWVTVWHPFITGRRARWHQGELLIESMLTRGDIWFAPMEEIAAHVRKCIDEGSYTPRVDNLPVYEGRIPELPADAVGEGI